MSPLQIDSSFGGTAITLLSVVTMLFNVVVMIFWIMVGWRAMRAHEEIADTQRGRAREPPAAAGASTGAPWGGAVATRSMSVLTSLACW